MPELHLLTEKVTASASGLRDLVVALPADVAPGACVVRRRAHHGELPDVRGVLLRVLVLAVVLHLDLEKRGERVSANRNLFMH